MTCNFLRNKFSLNPYQHFRFKRIHYTPAKQCNAMQLSLSPQVVQSATASAPAPAQYFRHSHRLLPLYQPSFIVKHITSQFICVIQLSHALIYS